MATKKKVSGQVETQEALSYGAVFLVTTSIVAFLSIWMVYDEMFTRREWKGYQQEFFALDADRTRTTLDAALAELETDGAKAQVAAIEGALLENDARRETDEMKALAQEIDAQEVIISKITRQYQFAKSTSDEYYYYYKHAQHSAHKAAHGGGHGGGEHEQYY